MHTAHSHVAGGAGGPPQPVQSGPPDCFLLCSLQEAEGVRHIRAGANATPVAQTLFSPEEHSGSSFCLMRRVCAASLSPQIRWGLCCSPFVCNGTLVGQGLISGDVGQMCQARDEQVRMGAVGHGPAQGLGKLLPFSGQPCSYLGPALRAQPPAVSPSWLCVHRLLRISASGVPPPGPLS